MISRSSAPSLTPSTLCGLKVCQGLPDAARTCVSGGCRREGGAGQEGVSVTAPSRRCCFSSPAGIGACRTFQALARVGCGWGGCGRRLASQPGGSPRTQRLHPYNTTPTRAPPSLVPPAPPRPHLDDANAAAAGTARPLACRRRPASRARRHRLPRGPSVAAGLGGPSVEGPVLGPSVRGAHHPRRCGAAAMDGRAPPMMGERGPAGCWGERDAGGGPPLGGKGSC